MWVRKREVRRVKNCTGRISKRRLQKGASSPREVILRLWRDVGSSRWPLSGRDVARVLGLRVGVELCGDSGEGRRNVTAYVPGF